MPLDLRSTPVRLGVASAVVSALIAVFWELLPPYGVRPPFGLPGAVVLLADIVALFLLTGVAIAVVAALTGWVVELDRTASRRWQGVVPMSLGFYLARHGEGVSLAPNLDEIRRQAALVVLQAIVDRGDSTVFVLTERDGFVDRVIVATPALPDTVREWADRMSATHVTHTSRGDRAELARRYPGLPPRSWWISWA
jgi:hypothetical protein